MIFSAFSGSIAPPLFCFVFFFVANAVSCSSVRCWNTNSVPFGRRSEMVVAPRTLGGVIRGGCLGVRALLLRRTLGLAGVGCSSAQLFANSFVFGSSVVAVLSLRPVLLGDDCGRSGDGELVSMSSRTRRVGGGVGISDTVFSLLCSGSTEFSGFFAATAALATRFITAFETNALSSSVSSRSRELRRADRTNFGDSGT